ncbi:MAG: carboxypeptidase-like regulatory domain-containing protein [Lachnospiraceae bacterium]
MSGDNKETIENKEADNRNEIQNTEKRMILFREKRKKHAAIKRKKDEFSVTLIGMIIYGVVLIAIVTGTYLGIKSFFSSNEKKNETTEVINPIEDPEDTTGSENAVPTEPAAEQTGDGEEPMAEELIDVSSLVNGDNNYIDYSRTVFKPAKRDVTLTWEDRVFSRLENVKNPSEALVNTYQFSRKYAVREDEKKMEYLVYTNSETEKIEKITAIEYCGDDIETIDYYYDNGKINYIAQHRSIINTPVDISSAAVQSRYYFNQDVMVKYSYCEDNKATEYLVSELTKYSSGTVGQYDYLEETLLNWAYLTYYAVSNIAETEQIEGYVLDEFNMAMADAQIQLSSDSKSAVVAKTTTNGDGYYSLILPADDADTYTLTINKNTLDEVKVYGIKAVSGSAVYAVEPVYLAYTEVGAVYNVQIMVRDAENAGNAGALSDAALKLRNGINNRSGDVIATGTLDATGAITAPMRAGSYTAEITKGGYETSYFTVIVRMDRQAVLGYAVSDVGENKYKVALSWDTTPLDLDARAFSSNAANVVRSQNDSVGLTTAEVINLEGADSYQYYVSDYSNCTGGDMLSYNMSTSNAVIAVYSADGLLASYHVPMAHCGVIWRAFEIRNQKLLPINDYFSIIEPDSYWTSK